MSSSYDHNNNLQPNCDDNDKPIILLIGEGNFSYTKCLIKYNNYPNYIIISTDLNDNTDGSSHYNELINHETYNRSLFIKFEIDVTNLNWGELFRACFPSEAIPIRPPNIIQFNCPWQFGYDNAPTNKLVLSLFEIANEILPVRGLLKLATVTENSPYFKQYELESTLVLFSNFMEILPRFKIEFPEYRHVSVSGKTVGGPFFVRTYEKQS
jgi:hypothetical protein